MNKFNIKPLHANLQSMGNSTTITSLVSNYRNNNKAYQSLQAIGASTTITSLKISGYQYLLGSATVQIVCSYEDDLPFSDSLYTLEIDFPQISAETIPFGDELFIKVTNFLEEDMSLGDAIFNGTTTLEEDCPFNDSLFIKATVTLEEDLPANDSLFLKAATLLSDGFAQTDSLLVGIRTFLEEDLSFGDVFSSYQSFKYQDSLRISVQSYLVSQDTLNIGVKTYLLDQDTMVVIVKPYALPAVVDYTSSSNPFLPTVILGGIVYVTNPSTAPPSYDSDTYFIQWNNNI